MHCSPSLLCFLLLWGSEEEGLGEGTTRLGWHSSSVVPGPGLGAPGLTFPLLVPSADSPPRSPARSGRRFASSPGRPSASQSCGEDVAQPARLTGGAHSAGSFAALSRPRWLSELAGALVPSTAQARLTIGLLAFAQSRAPSLQPAVPIEVGILRSRR